nr:BadF/BadG/BcrA/BcrD ATPase family protein [Pontibacillus yanchengensis]
MYIGIDGGGSKTEAMMCDEKGVVVARTVGGSTNVKSRSTDAIKQTLKELFHDLFIQADVAYEHVTGVFVSSAGGDRLEDHERWQDWIYEVAPGIRGKMDVRNDAYGALASGTFSMEGTVLIAGTGSIAYSILDGESRRVGGWGYLLGDEGSGYDLGRQALSKVAHMHDGLMELDLEFMQIMLTSLQVDSAAEVITAVYEDDYPRRRIASLAEHVILLAQAGNATARQIIGEALRSLLELVDQVHSEDVPLVLSGGMFQSTFMRLAFCNLFEKKYPHHHAIIHPDVPPVVGALVCALLLGEETVTNEVKENLQSSSRSLNRSFT